MTTDIRPLISDPKTKRDQIRARTTEGIKNLFPIEGRNKSIEVKNVKVTPREHSSRKQKDALMKGQTLHEPITGTLVLRDKKTGAVEEEKKNHTLAHVPYFTERHTFIVGGNEYDLPSQLRLKPGVYTRERGNGEFEAAFNLSKGSNFRLSMEPESGKLNMELGTTKIPLYSFLRGIGVPDADIRNNWGQELRDINASFSKGDDTKILNKVINKIKRKGDSVPNTLEGKKEFIRSYFENTAMDPKVNEKTLGIPADRANSTALLNASKKLVKVHRREAEEDDRDSLEFKTVHSVDDFMKERLDIDARRSIARKLQYKLNQPGKKTLSSTVPNSTFTKSLNTFITNSSMSAIPMQINPVEMIDHGTRLTSLGEGGITSERAIPDESRKVHNTHLGIIDPVRTPDTFRAGIDVRSSLAGHRDDKGNLYSLIKDARTGRDVHVSAADLAKSVVAFPGQDLKGRKKVDALKGNETVSVDPKEVDYIIPNENHMLGPTSSLVPLLNGMQGNRAIMGAKFQTQALPLVEREAPYVQAAGPRKGQSMEKEIAKLIAPISPVDGTVDKVDDDYIYITPDKDAKEAAADKVKLTYNSNFPFASKTYLHNDLKVKPGQRVNRDQILADTNFTKDDTLALGKNMSTGYMAYRGKNSNDAVVISEGASKKLTSEHMYKESLNKGPDVILGKDKYSSYYGAKFTADQLSKLDSEGVAKPGVTLQQGDPVILALKKSAPTPEAALLGNFHKSLVKPYKDYAVTWDHVTEGKVVDAINSPRQIMVTIHSREQMKVGDKLANRYGGKGVVSEIVPDEKMVKDEEGKPVDVLFTSAGIVSRINPAQVVEASLGKVAEKTGKPMVVKHFNDKDNVKFAKEELKKHGLKDKETVYDPVSGKHVPNIFVGRSYIQKLFKSTDTNYSARGVDKYDVNMQPTKGGEEGAKGLGRMEINALLAHNARNVLKEDLTTKSEKSDEYWRAFEFGYPPPPAKNPFVAEKFSSMLTGAGINVNKQGSQMSLAPLTDKDVEKFSSGPLSSPSLEKSRSFMVNAKNLSPERGGLFDPTRTGGLNGMRWSHMDLSERVVNPTFEEPVRRLLGLSKEQLRKEVQESGGEGIRARLNKIDLDKKEKELLAQTKTKRGSSLDDAVKQLKYVRSLKKDGYKKAGDAYTLSKVPVVPPLMRPILPSSKGGEIQVSDINYLYRDVGLASEGLRGIKDLDVPSATAEARQHLHDSTSALFGLTPPTSPQLQGRNVKGFVEQITGSGSPKSGFLHKKLLKRQQDLSGRATATPDLTLDMDQIGVPEDMLWTTYSKFIMKGLIGQGYKPAMAKEMIENRHPSAKSILDAEIQKRPMFVNRAPSLHKHNVVSAYPVPVPGKSLRVNPFMEKGQNLDYDGDTMQLHVPVSDDAVKESKDLTLSKLLFGDKSRDDLMVFPQHEAILGTYMATSKKEPGPVKKFKSQAEAMKAYKDGKITMNTPVEIK